MQVYYTCVEYMCGKTNTNRPVIPVDAPGDQWPPSPRIADVASLVSSAPAAGWRLPRHAASVQPSGSPSSAATTGQFDSKTYAFT